MLTPLVLLVSNGFKRPQELLAQQPSIIPLHPTSDNYAGVIADTPLLTWMFNSLAFALVSTASVVITSVVAGYIFAKFKYRTFTLIFMIALATALIPFEVYMIPLYFKVKSLGLMNTIWGLSCGYLVMSFGIFLIKQNATHSVPDELLEAARIDGASETWIFFYVAVPLLRGALGALAILAFFQAWTAFTWPMIVTTTQNSYTIEVGLALFQTGFTVDVGRLSAAASLALIPSVTLFLWLRRSLVQGVATTGMKE
jgi:multiple sugar transport system permease protein